MRHQELHAIVEFQPRGISGERENARLVAAPAASNPGSLLFKTGCNVNVSPRPPLWAEMEKPPILDRSGIGSPDGGPPLLRMPKGEPFHGIGGQSLQPTLRHFPRGEFAALLAKHKGEYRAKGFDCWTQLVSMLFCQLAHADSLREIRNGLSCCLGKLVHLGIGTAPDKSTLSYANEHRPVALFEDLFYTALQRFRDEQGLGRRKAEFHFKNKLAVAGLDDNHTVLQPVSVAKFRKATRAVSKPMLLLEWPHRLSKAKWSLSNLASLLRLNLFTYRDLLTWLDEPFGTPPLPQTFLQLPLLVP